jgi:hypothetical protein
MIFKTKFSKLQPAAQELLQPPPLQLFLLLFLRPFDA